MALYLNGTTGISGVDGSAGTPAVQGTDTNTGISFPAADTVAVNTGGSERSRVDSSGRLLLGTSTSNADYNSDLQIAGASTSFLVSRYSANAAGPYAYFYKSRSTTIGTGTIVQNGDELGSIYFGGSDGVTSRQAAAIQALVDGTPGSGDYPGRLVFSTTADGASSPTERMRIQSDGYVLIGKTAASLTTGGIEVRPVSADEGLYITNTRSSGGEAMLINRQASDGNLIEFRQANTVEGTISVSGTTVTYGGGHLARWSQLPNNEDPSGILKGTVMSNLDEMCEWGEEDNEQLNKTKISDIEGDKNVAGVFVSTSFSDDGPLDFFVGMTGDMIIRIAEGVTVERGDLLMSAGDGTAKPQGDGYVQDKTIAKVTSTNVSCTYDDGSYCVPCVLMAC